MGRLGFEPKTDRLKAECSTAELATRVPCDTACIKYRARLITLTHNLGQASSRGKKHQCQLAPEAIIVPDAERCS